MNFPIEIRFKLLSLSPQIAVTDATGAIISYVKQKLFKLRETVNVFSDEKQTNQVATITADSALNWSARFNIADATGKALGAIGRKGFRSMWRAHYDLFTASGEPAGTIREENPFARVIDSMIGEIPLIGMFSGFVFQPRYLLAGVDGTPILRLKKKVGFLQRFFHIEKLSETSPEETHRNVLASLMLVMLERRRK